MNRTTPIRKLVFDRGKSTVTCVLGEPIKTSTPRRVGRRIRDDLAPDLSFSMAVVDAIVEHKNGTVYRVSWHGGPSSWANPFMVGKHHVHHVE